MQDALERFTPWAGHVRKRDDPESAGAPRLLDIDSFRFHRRTRLGAGVPACQVFALLGGLLWLMKRRGSLQLSGRRSGARLEVLERVPLTPHHALHLVRIAGKVVLIGTAPSACTLLDQTSLEAGAQQDLLRTSQ